MADQDSSIHEQITRLVEREHQLRADISTADREQRTTDQAELHEVERQLDVCWDLLRQRQAKREFGQDEGEASARPESTVENYRQ